MKTLTKTFALNLLLIATMLFSTSNAQADYLRGEGSTQTLADSTKAEAAVAYNDAFDYDFEDPFFFDDNIVINVYNQEDELVYTRSFSKEEADNNTELNTILKQSEFLLSINNEYYYSTNTEIIAMN